MQRAVSRIYCAIHEETSGLVAFDPVMKKA